MLFTILVLSLDEEKEYLSNLEERKQFNPRGSMDKNEEFNRKFSTKKNQALYYVQLVKKCLVWFTKNRSLIDEGFKANELKIFSENKTSKDSSESSMCYSKLSADISSLTSQTKTGMQLH